MFAVERDSYFGMLKRQMTFAVVEIIGLGQLSVSVYNLGTMLLWILMMLNVRMNTNENCTWTMEFFGDTITIQNILM